MLTFSFSLCLFLAHFNSTFYHRPQCLYHYVHSYCSQLFTIKDLMGWVFFFSNDQVKPCDIYYFSNFFLTLPLLRYTPTKITIHGKRSHFFAHIFLINIGSQLSLYGPDTQFVDLFLYMVIIVVLCLENGSRERGVLPDFGKQYFLK